MFVRIVRLNENGRMGPGGLDQLFECQEVQMLSLDDDRVLLEINHLTPSKMSTHEILKSGTEVYYMNNAGQTIDTFRWSTKA